MFFAVAMPRSMTTVGVAKGRCGCGMFSSPASSRISSKVDVRELRPLRATGVDGPVPVSLVEIVHGLVGGFQNAAPGLDAEVPEFCLSRDAPLQLKGKRRPVSACQR